MAQAGEPVLVEALVAKLAVEALDEAVLDRLARPDEDQRHAAVVGPLVEALPQFDAGPRSDPSLNNRFDTAASGFGGFPRGNER